MIIDNSYFVQEFYIPEAKPGLANDEDARAKAKVSEFVVDYVQECLVKSLGITLARELISKLDSAEDNGIKADVAETKWDELLNGRTYIINGVEKHWRGIRFKNTELASKYNRSLLTPYVYFFYEQNDHITRSRVGNIQEKSKNAWAGDNFPKAAKAWHTFVDMIQGSHYHPRTIDVPFMGFESSVDQGILAIDFYNENEEVSMYEYIRDANKLNMEVSDPKEDYYLKFKPKFWERGGVNEYGF